MPTVPENLILQVGLDMKIGKMIVPNVKLFHRILCGNKTDITGFEQPEKEKNYILL